MTIEFSRLVPLSKAGPSRLTLTIQASAEECAALARRMDIPAVQHLTCAYALTRDAADAGIIVAVGRLRGRMTRICVVSAEEFDVDVTDDFRVRFVPAGTERDEVDPDLDDEIPYEGTLLDLGEAATEQLGLALDPYPRMDGAVAPEAEPGESPFTVLAKSRTIREP